VRTARLTTRQKLLLVDAWLGAESDGARESLLQTVRGTQTDGGPNPGAHDRRPSGSCTAATSAGSSAP
jgi:hypothetical protein